MYVIAIAWLYVALLTAASNDSIVGGVLTFAFFGLGPLCLFLWICGSPVRRRRRRAAATNGLNDRTESDSGQ